MGIRLMGVDIAGIVNKAMGKGLLPAKLVKSTPGPRGDDSTAGRDPADSTFSARGFTEDYSESHIDGELIQKGDRRVMLLGDSISGKKIPEPGDSITIEGATYKIVKDGVRRDPAAATYTCHVRR